MPQAKLSQSISKQEALNVLDHYLYEGKVSIDLYGELVSGLRNFDGNRDIRIELVMDEPVVLIIK